MNHLISKLTVLVIAVLALSMTMGACATNSDRPNADDVLKEMKLAIESVSDWERDTRLEVYPDVTAALAGAGEFEQAFNLARELELERKDEALVPIAFYAAKAGETELVREIIEARPGMRVWGSQNPPDYQDPLEILLAYHSGDADVLIDRLGAQGDLGVRFYQSIGSLSDWLAKFPPETAGRLLDVGMGVPLEADKVDYFRFEEVMNPRLRTDDLAPFLEAIKHMRAGDEVRIQLASFVTYRAARLGKLELALASADYEGTLGIDYPYDQVVAGLIDADELDLAYGVLKSKPQHEALAPWLSDQWLETAITMGMPRAEAQAWFNKYLKHREVEEPYWGDEKPAWLQSVLGYLAQSDEERQAFLTSLDMNDYLQLKSTLTIRQLHLGDHDEARRLFDSYRRRLEMELEALDDADDRGDPHRIRIGEFRAGGPEHVRMFSLGVKVAEPGILQEAGEILSGTELRTVLERGLSVPYAWEAHREELVAAVGSLISSKVNPRQLFSRENDFEVSNAGEAVLHDAIVDRVLAGDSDSRNIVGQFVDSARAVGRLDEIAEQIENLFEGRVLHRVQVDLVHAYALEGQIDRSLALARNEENDGRRARLMANILFGMGD